MNDACHISVIIYTLNEEVNLPRCLSSLLWCDDVVVVDSFSTDRTEMIARAAGARFIQHEFTGFGDQRNWSLSNVSLKHSWVLILDADESTPLPLALEMNGRVKAASEDTAAFRLRRRLHLWGKWLRFSGLYPTWVVRLVHVGRVRYVNRGHAETQVVEGLIEPLRNDLIDENLKAQHDWWDRQNVYSTEESLYEESGGELRLGDIFSRDPLKRREVVKMISRRIPFRPFLYFLYTYIFRLGFLDGVVGFRFCLMKTMYVEMIELKKYERTITRQRGLPAAEVSADAVRPTRASYRK